MKKNVYIFSVLIGVALFFVEVQALQPVPDGSSEECYYAQKPDGDGYYRCDSEGSGCQYIMNRDPDQTAFSSPCIPGQNQNK